MRGVSTLLASICLTLLVAVFLPQSSNAKVIHVNSLGGGDYTSIQDAIDAANNSDTIYVHSGMYEENIIINKSIILQGEGSDSTEIHGSNSHTVKILASNVSIRGFTVENTGVSSSFSGVFLSSVSNCYIKEMVVREAGNGVYLVNSNSNILMGNYIYSSNIGIYLSNSDGNIIQENDIKNNNAYGIYITSTSNGNTLHLNDFSDNNLGNAYDLGDNSWSYQSQGNYWSDYNGYDKNRDGIGDTPYFIDDDSIDYYPLGYFLSYNEQPVAYIDSITPNPAVEGVTVEFNGHGVDDGSILEWEWYSSIDGLLSTSEDFLTSTLSTGTHTITFRVRDDQGQWSEYAEETLVVQPEKPVTKNQQPIAEIVTVSPREAPIGSSVYFHGYGLDDDGYIVAYSWRSSIDGVISTSPTFSTSNLSLGYHIIYFKVKDNEGSWSKEDIIDVRITDSKPQGASPTPNTGGPYTGVVNETIIFNASESFDPNETPLVSYQWDFGDGGVATGKVVTHIYTTPGNYTVRLTVRNQEGLEASAVTYVVVTPSYSSNSDENSSSPPPIHSLKDLPGFEVSLSLLFIFLLFKRWRL